MGRLDNTTKEGKRAQDALFTCLKHHEASSREKQLESMISFDSLGQGSSLRLLATALIWNKRWIYP